MSRFQQFLLFTLAFVVVVFGYVLWTRVLFPPPQITFIDASLEPATVRPGDRLVIRASADVRSPSECFSGTQRILRFSTGTETRLPGTRASNGDGQRQSIAYDMIIPTNAPAGEATVQVREIFTCGGGDPVNGPVLRFWVER